MDILLIVLPLAIALALPVLVNMVQEYGCKEASELLNSTDKPAVLS